MVSLTNQQLAIVIMPESNDGIARYFIKAEPKEGYDIVKIRSNTGV
jgi:hypothetical protein